MNFRDQWATDENGEKFIFTIEQQRALYNAGFPVEATALIEFRKKHAPKAAPAPKKKERQVREKTEVTEMEVDPATGKYIGVLKSYNKQKGFGFIDQGGNNNDIYFNKKRTLDDPRYFNVGQKLLYELNMFRGKEEAIDVEEYEEF